MAVVLRTEDVPVAERLDYWRAARADSFVSMDVRVDNPTVPSRMTVGQLGSVQVAEVDEGPGEAVRGSRHIRRSDVDGYIVFVAVRGPAAAEHNGRHDIVLPGDFALSDLARPFRCRFPARRAVCVTVHLMVTDREGQMPQER